MTSIDAWTVRGIIRSPRRKPSRLRALLVVLAVSLAIGEIAAQVYTASNPEAGIGHLPRYAQRCVVHRDVLEKSPEERGELVFFFGASTMQGVPYDPTLTPVAWMERLCRDVYPDEDVELINFGHGGAASPYLAAAVEHTIEYRPDLVVVMVGNNEFLGREPADTSVLTKVGDGLRSTSLGRLGNALAYSVRGRVRTARTYFQVSRELRESADADSSGTPRTAAREAADWQRSFLRTIRDPRRIPGSVRSAELIGELRANLVTIARTCKEHDVPLLVASPPYNLRYPPRATCFRASDYELEEWTCLTGRGLELYERGEYEAALVPFRQAQAIDETNALLAFHVASCLEALGDVDGAIHQYEVAIRYDTRRVRMFDDVEATIRSVCGELEVPYLNVQERFSALDGDGIVDFTLVVDNAHPTPLGQYLLARELLSFVRDESDVLPRDPVPNPRTFETVMAEFPLDEEFEYSTNRRLGDYHRWDFDAALEYYRKAYAARPTPEICLRAMELCRRHERPEAARPWSASLAGLTVR